MDIFKAYTILFIGLVFILSYLAYPKKIFLLYILIKPIIDRFAEQGASIGGITIGYHYLAALIIPTMSVLYVILKKVRVSSVPLKILLLCYIASNCFAFLLEGKYTLDNAGYYIRVVFPIFLYFTIPFILDKESDILKLIKYTAISGIFPSLMIFLQRIGIVAQNRVAEGFGAEVYDRATGGYADSFSAALPIIISLFCILFIVQHYKETRQRSFGYKIMIIPYLVAIFFTYHRMSFIVMTIVFLIWTVVNRRYVIILSVSVIIMISFPIIATFLPSFFADFYVSEKVHGSTSVDPKHKISNATLHGRAGLWRRYIDKYQESGTFRQIFGIEMAGRAPHNDYLRVLITNGLAGLSVYLVLLLVLGFRLLRTYIRSKRENDRFMVHFSLTAIFLYIFYLLGSVTLAISLLSTLTWFFWIFSGITFHRYFVKHRAGKETLNKVSIPA